MPRFKSSKSSQIISSDLFFSVFLELWLVGYQATDRPPALTVCFHSDFTDFSSGLSYASIFFFWIIVFTSLCLHFFSNWFFSWYLLFYSCNLIFNLSEITNLFYYICELSCFSFIHFLFTYLGLSFTCSKFFFEMSLYPWLSACICDPIIPSQMRKLILKRWSNMFKTMQ